MKERVCILSRKLTESVMEPWAWSCVPETHGERWLLLPRGLGMVGMGDLADPNAAESRKPVATAGTYPGTLGRCHLPEHGGHLPFPQTAICWALPLPRATVTLATQRNGVLCSLSSRKGDMLLWCNHLASV